MEAVKQEALAALETALKAGVEARFESFTDALLVELKKAIPGEVDDMIINAASPMVKPVVKQMLLDLIAKIHEDAVAAQ